MARIRRLLLRSPGSLSASEWAAFLSAQWALICVQFVVWTRPRGRLLVRSGGAPDMSTDHRVLTPEIRRVARSVERAAECGLYRPSCLVRALTLHRMLTGRGVRGSAVRIGARLEGGHFTAHAWVEYHGHVLGDHDSHVKRFSELARMDVA